MALFTGTLLIVPTIDFAAILVGLLMGICDYTLPKIILQYVMRVINDYSLKKHCISSTTY